MSLQIHLVIWLLTLVSKSELTADDLSPSKHPKCVSGFCLPSLYEKLETPTSEGHNTVNIEMDIMDVLQVRKQNWTLALQKGNIRINEN